MNTLGIFLTIACCWIVLAFPRREASLAFVIAALLVPRVQEIALGSLHFTALRMVILVGLFRVMARGEHIGGKWNFLDRIVALWAVWAVCSSAFHPAGFSMARFGEIYTAFGIYFLFRVFLRDAGDIQSFFRSVCIILVPIAAFMVIEKLKGNNAYDLLFDGSGEVPMRLGQYRAKGPFAHPITAGTVGALALPMALYLFQYKPRIALAGLVASVAIVIASGASGPVLSAVSVVFSMAIWKVRKQLVVIRWAGLLLLVLSEFLMTDPVYYLVARIDITGGSTSYYRAALIRSAIDHIDEWWLVGTDVTSHWASTQMGDMQTDITNQYIQMAVWGGLLLLSLYVAVLWAAFSCVGRVLRHRANNGADRFLIWTFGSILFGNVVTFFAVSYFDPANLFLLNVALAVIATRYSLSVANRKNIPYETVPAGNTMSRGS
jgi:hypothetical protein